MKPSRPPRTDGETADIVRVPTADGEVGIARFAAGHCVIVAQDARGTVLVALDADEARRIAAALLGSQP